MKTFLHAILLTVLVFAANANASEYCMGIRGNGDSEPAHWGAMARTIEQLGLPQAMAGGSSATISMFILEAMASHPLVKNQSKEIQKERVSLMLKSLLGFAGEVRHSESWKELGYMLGTVDRVKNGSVLTKLGEALRIRNWVRVAEILKQAIDLGIIDPQFAAPLGGAIKRRNLKQAKFYVQQMGEALAVLGRFDAARDQNLFFRTGVVNFAKLSVTLGRIAAFYAGTNDHRLARNYWNQFFNSCAAISVGKTWTELIKDHPSCQTFFRAAFSTHYSNETNPHLELKTPGYAIPVLASNTVLIGQAAKEALAGIKAYHQQTDRTFGKNFSISNPDEVKFGYWGSPSALAKITNNLDKSDEKSRRFYSLGSANWKTVLTYSPAEPGLSPLRAMGSGLVSAGGWSDLHPVQVLRAYGCASVVYITREGGESLFAQGVAKRLMKLERDWDLLDNVTPGKMERNVQMNNFGDPSDTKSHWSQLYNLGNPLSSIKRALKKADAIMCTDWNTYSVRQQLVELIDTSYRSPFFVQDGSRLSLSPLLREAKPGCNP